MDDILETILQSPKLPAYVDIMQEFLQKENEKRTDFYTMIRDDEKAEFINGEVICHSPAKNQHTILVDNIGSILTRFVRKSHSGVVLREKALIRLPRNDFEPDICYFRKELSDTFEPDTMFYPVPDFVVEVLSSGTEKRDRGINFIDYALNGVKEYWMVDAEKLFIEQYLLRGDQFELIEKVQHGTICCSVLKGLEIPLAAVFNPVENEDFLKGFF